MWVAPHDAGSGVGGEGKVGADLKCRPRTNLPSAFSPLHSTMRAASALVVALAATASAQFEDDSMSFDVWVGAAA
jgi:hypothetical protein